MGERYQIINKEENLHDGVSPILVVALAITKDEVTDNILLQLKMKNLAAVKITSLKVKLECFSNDDNLLETIEEYQYIDVNAGVNEEFGDKNAIFLEHKQVRKVVCNIVEVIYVDNSVYSNDKAIAFKPVVIDKISINSFGELQEQYIRSNKENSYTKIGEFLYAEGDSYDSCTCGEIISIHTEVCPHCNKNKDLLLKLQDTEYLKEEAENFAKLVKENNVTIDLKKEKKAAKKAKRRKRRRRFFGTLFLIIIIAIGSVFYYFNESDKRADKIKDMLVSSSYEEIAEYIITGSTRYHTPDMEYLKTKDLVAYNAVYKEIIKDIEVDLRVLMSEEPKNTLDIEKEFEIEGSDHSFSGAVGIGVINLRNYSDFPLELTVEWGAINKDTNNEFSLLLGCTSFPTSYHIYNSNSGKYLLSGAYLIKIYDTITEHVYIEKTIVLD